MLDEKYIKKLFNLRTFKRTMHELENSQFKLSRDEAQSELLFQLKKRTKKYSGSYLKKMIDNEDDSFLWKITYSGKDALRVMFKDRQRQAELKRQAELNFGFIDFRQKTIDQKSINRVIGLLPQLFRKRSTRDFIKLVLTYGKKETMNQLNMTPKQFSRKVLNIETFCRKHKEKFIGIAINKKDEEFLNESKVLSEFIGLLESESYSDKQMQELINNHYKYIDDLIGTIPNIYSPLLLADNFEIANKQDQYKFVNKIYERKAEVGKKLENA